MTQIVGYFDAAGDNASGDAVTVGGCVFTARSSSRLKRDWRTVLDPVNIEVFHMTDFLAGRKAFAEWRGRTGEQGRVVRDLARVIKRHAHFAPASTVMLKDWEELNNEYRLKECRATPYAIAAISVISKTLQWIKREHPNDEVKQFTFEEGDRNQGDFTWFVDFVVSKARKTLMPVRPVFEAKSVAQLQAADLMLWEQRNVVVKRLRGEMVEVRESLKILLPFAESWGLMNRARIQEWAERLDA